MYYLNRLSIATALAIGNLAVGSVTYGADINYGRTLYNKDCTSCHTTDIHGPKSSIKSPEKLRKEVSQWAKDSGLKWSEEETNDVTEFLIKEFYLFDKAEK
ncbi:MAG: cytochrome c [Gammaproteobacteria bacterium]|nr:cytochrome c [Gammaproteobacteria bacterium]